MPQAHVQMSRLRFTDGNADRIKSGDHQLMALLLAEGFVKEPPVRADLKEHHGGMAGHLIMFRKGAAEDGSGTNQQLRFHQ